MTSTDIDAARLTLALTELRLPAIKALWPRFAEQADKEGWRAARLLSALVEHELAERDRRRIERHLAQGPPAARQDARDLRLQRRSHALQGACQCHHRPLSAKARIRLPRNGRQLDRKG